MARGGKREGAGRRALPPHERRDVILRVRLTQDESEALQAHEERTGETARDVLIGALQHSAS